MFKFLNWLLTWWNGNTLGTWIYTKRQGRFVGEDLFGNTYYQTRDAKRRWVLYKGLAEPSLVPPEWHGWLHHTVDEPPTVAPPKVKAWEKEHLPNLTGTPFAYRPPGSLLGRANARMRPAITKLGVRSKGRAMQNGFVETLIGAAVVDRGGALFLLRLEHDRLGRGDRL